MKRKLILSITFCLFSLIGFAQHLTYTDLIKIGKMESITAVSEYVSARGYDYAGSHQKDSTIVVRWTRNCHITVSSFDNYHYEWSNGVSPSVLSVSICPSYDAIELILPSKQAFNALKTTLKTNGFKFKFDNISNGNLDQIYDRTLKTKLERFILIEGANGSFSCLYYP